MRILALVSPLIATQSMLSSILHRWWILHRRLNTSRKNAEVVLCLHDGNRGSSSHCNSFYFLVFWKCPNCKKNLFCENYALQCVGSLWESFTSSANVSGWRRGKFEERQAQRQLRWSWCRWCDIVALVFCSMPTKRDRFGCC